MYKDITCNYNFSLLDSRGNIHTSLTFTLTDDCDINDFAYMCSRFAAALGYSEKSIDAHFSVDDGAFETFYEENK